MIGRFMQRQRHQEFIRLLNAIEVESLHREIVQVVLHQIGLSCERSLSIESTSSPLSAGPDGVTVLGEYPHLGALLQPMVSVHRDDARLVIV